MIDLTTIVKFDLDLVKKHAGSILALTEFIFYMGKNRKKEINSLKIIHFILIFRPLLIVVLSNIAMYIYASVILKRITRRTASLRQSCKITKPHGSHEIEEDSDSNVKKQFSRALSTVTKSAKKTKDAAKIEKYFFNRKMLLFGNNKLIIFQIKYISETLWCHGFDLVI